MYFDILLFFMFSKNLCLAVATDRFVKSKKNCVLIFYYFILLKLKLFWILVGIFCLFLFLYLMFYLFFSTYAHFFLYKALWKCKGNNFSFLPLKVQGEYRTIITSLFPSSLQTELNGGAILTIDWKWEGWIAKFKSEGCKVTIRPKCRNAKWN